MNTQVNQVLQKAKKSFKIFSFNKKTFAKARTLVRIPSAAERKKLTTDRILAGLKKVGVATQTDLDALYQKIQKLEAALRQKSKASSKQTATQSKRA